VDWIEPIEQKSPFSSTFRKKASAQPGKTKKKRRAGWKKPGPVYLHLNVSRLVGNVPERNERKWTVVGRPQSASLVEMEFSLSCPSKGLSYNSTENISLAANRDISVGSIHDAVAGRLARECDFARSAVIDLKVVGDLVRAGKALAGHCYRCRAARGEIEI